MAKFPSRNSFVAWLREREESVVGKTPLCLECPLANFLGSIKWGRQPMVSSCFAYEAFRSCAAGYPLPKWAARFVAAIDEAPFRREVLGKDALKALGERV